MLTGGFVSLALGTVVNYGFKSNYGLVNMVTSMSSV